MSAAAAGIGFAGAGGRAINGEERLKGNRGHYANGSMNILSLRLDAAYEDFEKRIFTHF